MTGCKGRLIEERAHDRRAPLPAPHAGNLGAGGVQMDIRHHASLLVSYFIKPYLLIFINSDRVLSSRRTGKMTGKDAGRADPGPYVRIGARAPDFTARSTRGPLTLSGLRGRWVVFFSHPADFTPVCTSEFMAFAREQDSFEALGCSLVGLSVDSLPSHLAWVEAIRRDLGVKIRFPVVEDPSMAVARAYGMLDEKAEHSGTVRATFIIDPHGIVQAMLWYPLTVGRSVKEILRAVQALQRVARGSALTPEGWQPGEDILLPAPETLDDAGGAAPWFYRTMKDSVE